MMAWSKVQLDGIALSEDPIPFAERDHQLSLWTTDDVIANGSLDGWQAAPNRNKGRYLERNLWTVTARQRDGIYKENESLLARQLKELGQPRRKLAFDDPIDLLGSHILRERLLAFPSAPLLHQGGLPDRSLAHTMRVLDLPSRGNRPVDRVFLLHNGLDELLGMEFFYNFSASLLTESANNGSHAACIIRPFPNHLTRFPVNPRFSQTPLDEYLLDSSDLFKSYLRYMIETQWLLSALAPRDRYLSLSGSRLTGTRTHEGSGSRATNGHLASSMRSEFESIRKNSAGEARYATPGYQHFRKSIATIRGILGVKPSKLDSAPSEKTPERPTIHTIGYSLGGFVAQSIFITWPYVIASCGTICSGGALEELTPVAFAHPQEWQTLTHSLRYRLDELLEGLSPAERPGVSAERRKHVLGLRPESFDYFKRVFYEVFEQNYRASYQTRISEYLQRVIFVVGGNDPVVTPKSVLDATPAEGANLIEVGGLTHFVSSSKLAKNKLETEQRDFWFPEVARLVARWAPEAERVFRRSLRKGWRRADNSGFAQSDEYSLGQATVSDEERHEIARDGGVATPVFERLLDAMTVKVSSSKGFLFILRNEIPTFMLSDDFHIYRAKALHHSEDMIHDYLSGLQKRRDELCRIGRGVVVVLPWNALDRLRSSFEPGITPATSEVPVGEYFDPLLRTPKKLVEDVCDQFQSQWLDARDNQMPDVRLFYPGRLYSNGTSDPVVRSTDGEEVQLLADKLDFKGLMKLSTMSRFLKSDGNAAVNRLPDCWMLLDSKFCFSFAPTMGDWEGPLEYDLQLQAAEDLVTHTAMVVSDEKMRERKLVTAPSSWLNLDAARMIVMSRARYNPRYRGRVITEFDEMVKLILHSTLGVLRSERVNPENPVDSN